MRGFIFALTLIFLYVFGSDIIAAGRNNHVAVDEQYRSSTTLTDKDYGRKNLWRSGIEKHRTIVIIHRYE